MSTAEGNNIVINIVENFSVEAAGQFRESAKEYVEKGTTNFVLDFSNCKFIDSTGLGVIVGIYKKCLEHKGTVKLQHLNADVLKVFKMTRLDKVFEIQP